MKKQFQILLVTGVFLLTGCTRTDSGAKSEDSVQYAGCMPLTYAEQFSVDYCTDGCSVIHIGNESFLLVPEGGTIPKTNDVPVLQQPLSNLYVAASSAMDLIDAAGGLNQVRLTSTDRKDWSLPNIQDAFDREDLTFIGKYSAPDYEALTETDCDLTVESTMILHTPAVKEQIEAMGIPVLTERSSYEPHPLGRLEWIKLYGLLLGKYEQAEAFFKEKEAEFLSLNQPNLPEDQRLTCAFFSINANHAVTIRKPGDYISKMIELAGGSYIFTAEQLHTDETALSTMTIQMEAFYETAKDADILIYNSTIEGPLGSIEQLVSKSKLFQDFSAVKNDRVWCTEQNLFQQTTGTADMMKDLNLIFTDSSPETEQLTYLRRIH